MASLKGNAILIAALALAGGVAAMALLYFIFTSASEPEAVSEPAAVGPAAPAEGETFTLFVRNVPAPFRDPGSGEVVGYLFLDVAFEVTGEEARAAAEERLDLVSASFSMALSAAGAGKAEAPGVPDFERIAGIFRAEAEQALGPGVVGGVTVEPARQGGESGE